MRTPIPAWTLALPCALVLACTGPAADTGPGHGYLNANLGIRIDMPDAWTLFDTRAEAPAIVQSYFPHDKGPDESPLFIGMRIGQQAFARALVEPAPLETLRYFELLIEAFGGEVETLSARYSAETDAVRWVYRARGGLVDVVFHETVAVVAGHGYRLAFWSMTSQYARHEEEFEGLAETFRFRSEQGWQARFAGLSATLPDEDLDIVTIASLETAETSAIECSGGRESLLWGIEHQGSVVHLFGSIHLGRPDFFPLPDEVEQALQAADSLVVEIDLSSAENQAEMADLASRGALPPDETLRDVLSPSLYRRLELTLEDLRVPMASVERFEPWMLALTLSVLKMQSLGFGPEDGVERYLLAKRGDREVLELESADEQFSVFESLDGERYLAYTLLSLADMDEHTEELVEAWYCGREETLERMLLSDPRQTIAGNEDILERLFFDRNERMSERIEQLLAHPGRYFVVVGAGHMVGERGIPSLLRGRGFAVERQ